MNKISKYLIIIVLSFFLFNNNCFASTNTFERTNDNLRVPKDVIVSENNINDIIATPSVKSSEKIYDFADVLTKSEEKKLYNNITQYISDSKYDAVIVTTNNLCGFSISNYTYNFYDYNDFSDEGIIFVIYLNGSDPEIFMGNSGDQDSKIFTLYNQQMINSSLRYLYENSISKGNYFEACNNYIKIIEGFYAKNSTGNFKVNDEGKIVKSIPFIEIGVISVALTFIIMVLLVTGFKNKKILVKENVDNYLNKNTMVVKNEYDKLLK